MAENNGPQQPWPPQDPQQPYRRQGPANQQFSDPQYGDPQYSDPQYEQTQYEQTQYEQTQQAVPQQPYGPPRNGQPGYGQQQYGQQQYGQQQYGQQAYGPYPGAPYGQYPGSPYGGYPPRPPSSSTGKWVLIAIAAIAVLALLGGLVTWLVVRGDDGPSIAVTASSSASSPSSTTQSYGPSSTVLYPPPTYSAPTTSNTTYYGSIAVSRTTGDVGYAVNALTQSSAVSSALSQCSSSSCETVVRFQNACGAVAQSQENLYWGWGWDTTRQGAIDAAMSGVHGARPKLLTAQCTSNAGGAGAGGSVS